MKKNKTVFCIFYVTALFVQVVHADQNSHGVSNESACKSEFYDYMKKGYIELGMSKDEVRQSWGYPKQTKIKNTSEYDEIWVYVPSWKFRNKLYFRNGILVKTEPPYLVVSKMEGHGILP